MKTSIIKPTIKILTGTVPALGLNFIFLIQINTFFTSANLASYFVIASLANIISVLMTLRLDYVILKADDPDIVVSSVFNILILMLIIALFSNFFIAEVFFAASSPDNIQRILGTPQAYWIILYASTIALWACVQKYYVRCDKLHQLRGALISQKVLLISITFILLLLDKGHLLILALILSYWIVIIVSFFVKNIPFRKKISLKILVENHKMITLSVPSSLLSKFTSEFMLLFISSNSGVHATATYGTCVRVINPVLTQITSAATLILNRESRSQSTFRNELKITGGISLLCGIFFACGMLLVHLVSAGYFGGLLDYSEYIFVAMFFLFGRIIATPTTQNLLILSREFHFFFIQLGGAAIAFFIFYSEKALHLDLIFIALLFFLYYVLCTFMNLYYTYTRKKIHVANN